jgi:SAM-dependent methyltransferase
LNGWYTGAQQKIVDEFVRPNPSMRILDVGCASGHVLRYIKGASYVGLDMNPRYIEAASAANPGKRFICADVATLAVSDIGQFDCVLLFGLLHHIDDQSASDLFSTLRKLVTANGRVISVDNCWTDGQSAFERFMVEHDRGKFARTGDAYSALARKSFPNVAYHIRKGMLRVPYSLLIMESSL